MPESKPVILGAEHVRRALADPSFFTQMPEFMSIQNKINAMAYTPGKAGCTSCRMRRIRNSVHSDFVSVLNTLSSTAMERLKKYIGAETLYINAMDPKTGRTVLKKY